VTTPSSRVVSDLDSDARDDVLDLLYVELSDRPA
jgi:hypothetical protein